MNTSTNLSPSSKSCGISRKVLFIIFFSLFLPKQLNSSDHDCTCTNNNEKLILAAANGDQELLDKVISNADTNINYQTNEIRGTYAESCPKKLTALHLAIASSADKYIIMQFNRSRYLRYCLNPNPNNAEYIRFIEDKSKSEHRLKIINTLLSHPNIDVNLQDENGNTPLLLTAICSKIGSVRLEIIKLLLEKGAFVDIKNAEEKSFLDYAAADPEIKKKYEEFAKKVNEKAQGASREIKENVDDFPLDIAHIIGQYLYYCPPLK